MADSHATTILIVATLIAGAVPAVAQDYPRDFRDYPPSGPRTYDPYSPGPHYDPNYGDRYYIPPRFDPERGQRYHVPREAERPSRNPYDPYRSRQRPKIDCWSHVCPGGP